MHRAIWWASVTWGCLVQPFACVHSVLLPFISRCSDVSRELFCPRVFQGAGGETREVVPKMRMLPQVLEAGTSCCLITSHQLWAVQFLSEDPQGQGQGQVRTSFGRGILPVLVVICFRSGILRAEFCWARPSLPPKARSVCQRRAWSPSQL